MKLDFAQKETAPRRAKKAGKIVTEVIEKAQEPVEGKAAADFAEASRIAGKRKSEIALSDIEKKKYEEGLDFETDVAGNIKLPPGTSPEDRGAIIQETESK